MIKDRKNNRQAGFTLVELSIAILFVAFILIFLFSTLIKVMATYNKGIQISQINQAIRQINADLTDQTRFGSKNIRYIPGSNRLCIGDVAYLWNVDRSTTLTGGNIAGLGDIYPNRFYEEASTIGTASRLRLVRVMQKRPTPAAPVIDYCADLSRYPHNNNTTANPNEEVSILLTNNTSVLRFEVGMGGGDRLLYFRIVLSTTGNNKARTDNAGVSYQCFDEGGYNQYCAFTDLKFYVYKRSY